eukprot:gene277-362_t
MRKLFSFLHRYGNLCTWIVLELFSLSLIFSQRLNTRFANIHSANPTIGSIYEWYAHIRQYPYMKQHYEQILNENAALKAQLLHNIQPAEGLPESIRHHSFKIIPAQVINNTTNHSKNYLTLNKGTLDGISSGMAVIAANGIVGYTKAVSPHFTTVTSLLHTDMLVSAKLKRSNAIGTIRWSGQNTLQVQLLYIPRHITIEVGDQVVTSGYDAAFYEGIPIGIISRVALHQASPFYDITVQISENLSSLQHVYKIGHDLTMSKPKLWLKYIGYLLAYASLQIIMGQTSIHLYKVTCFVYIGFFLSLPWRKNGIIIPYLIVGFFSGLIIDAFYNSIGIHAFTSVLLIYLRNLLLYFLPPITEEHGDEIAYPSLYNMGFKKFIIYTLLLTTVYHIVAYTLDAWRVISFFALIPSALVSIIISTLVIFLFQIITSPSHT